MGLVLVSKFFLIIFSLGFGFCFGFVPVVVIVNVIVIVIAIAVMLAFVMICVRVCVTSPDVFPGVVFPRKLLKTIIRKTKYLSPQNFRSAAPQNIHSVALSDFRCKQSERDAQHAYLSRLTPPPV